MKKHVLFAVMATTFWSTSVLSDSWVDDWFDSATYSGPSSFSTQNRHFMTGGSFSVRSQVKTDYPISITMPRISAGCGGIDGFMGGFSFLDADYLVDKSQRMMQAAPYIAVDMALKTMSKEFSDTLKAAEGIVSSLNSIQLDECRSMRPIVTAAMDRDPDAARQALGEVVNAKQIRESSSRLWQEATEAIADNNGSPPSDLAEEILGCPADIRDMFSGGSVIEKIAEKANMGAHANLIRGYFGDVVIHHENNMLVPEPVQPCSGNRDNHEGFLYGDSYERRADTMACANAGGKTVHEAIYERINSIANKIQNDQPLNSNDRAFAGEGTQLPIFRILQVAYEQGTLDDTVRILTDVTAAAYAARVADTFYYETYAILRTVSDSISTPSQDTNGKPCRMTVLAGAAGQIRELLREVRDARRNMMAQVSTTINEHTQFLGVVEESRRRMERIKLQEAQRLSGVSR